MQINLREYSNILQLDTETLLRFKYAPDGLVRALQMFFIVTLVAGLGIWLGLPVQLDRPVLYEVLSESPEKIAKPIGELATAAGEVTNELLMKAETEAEAVSPPLGPRVSRVIRLFGQWLSVPFVIMSDWFFMVLVAMLVAKMLGGRATLGQHLTVVFLASAPLVLLLPAYIPDLSPVIPITFALGISIFSRLIAIVGFGWALLILIKGLELVHEFSWWRAIGILVLSWLTVYVLLPLILILIGGYVLGF
jgi:hypothetical protein